MLNDKIFKLPRNKISIIRNTHGRKTQYIKKLNSGLIECFCVF